MYQTMAFAVLALFYAAYLLKMVRQASRGIKTNQIGSRQGETHAVEVAMGFATVAVLVAQVISIAFDWTWTAGWIRIVGFAIGLAGCAFFIAATIGLKDSWRAGIPKEDETEFVTDGIYSWSRNPAFLGFDLQYIGVCLMFCNPATIVLSLFAMVMLHLQIRQEEGYLSRRFGAKYLDYQKRVMRYVGRR